MIRATVWETDDDGEQVEVGAIVWDGEAVVADPPEDETLAAILSEPIWADGKELSSADGEAFVRGLSQQYTSAYLRVGKAEGKA